MTEEKSLPKLYRQKNAKRTDVWEIGVEVEGKKVFLMSHYGVLKGKTTTNRREINKTGNQKTLILQAYFRANKKWNDKIKKDGYVTDLNKVKNKIFVSPMLASKVTAKKIAEQLKKSFFYGQPKKDGFRLLVFRVKGKIHLISRKGGEFKGFPTLRKQLVLYFDSLSGFGKGKFYLDGELFISGSFEKLSEQLHLGRHQEDHDNKKLCYNIFDVFNLDQLNVPFKIRTVFLENSLKSFTNTQLHYLETIKLTSKELIEKQLATYLSQGHEGLILRDPEGPYDLHKRSKYLLKI